MFHCWSSVLFQEECTLIFAISVDKNRILSVSLNFTYAVTQISLNIMESESFNDPLSCNFVDKMDTFAAEPQE